MTTRAASAEFSGPARSFAVPAANSAAWPLAALALLLAMQLSMVFTRAVNWDEFWFYYHVADFTRGTLAQPLQSLHVRLFAWLPALPGSGVDKILTARLVMLACEAVTLAAIYALSRRFVERPVAVLAALLYLSAGFVLQHGFSFRTDPMATAALMSALAILGRCRLGLLPLAAFAALVAIAGMITIKTVLYAPAFVGLAWMRWSADGFLPATALRMAAAGLATGVVFALLYTGHSASLTTTTEGTAMAASASRWMFFLGVPPYWQMGIKAALTAPVLFLLALAAPFAIWRSGLPKSAKWGLSGLWLPLTLPLFYTNTAAYFYVFMLAPVAVSVTIAARALVSRYPLALVTGVLALLATGTFLMEDRKVIHRQRALVESAERLLPPGTAYFDHNGMLPSFVKANHLMTPSSIDGYHIGGRNAYVEALTREPVPLLLANDELIETLLDGGESALLPDDTKALRETYVHAWGPVWLAGFDFRSRQDKTLQVRVPGNYRLEGASLAIDGQLHRAGAVVNLKRGFHHFAAADGTARLIWHTRAPLPAREWDDGPLYVGF